jgi:hypothetical protein
MMILSSLNLKRTVNGCGWPNGLVVMAAWVMLLVLAAIPAECLLRGDQQHEQRRRKFCSEVEAKR